MSIPYALGTAPPARRALAERLSREVADSAVEFITGPLSDNPHRVDKELTDELATIDSARLCRSWRVLYEIDEVNHAVIVLDIRHRTTAYRSR